MRDYTPGTPVFAQHDARPVPEEQEQLAFLKKVYGLLTLTVIVAASGAFVSLYAGTSTSQVAITTSSGAAVPIPPLVLFFSEHWIIGIALFLGSFLGLRLVRHMPVINTAALLFTGLVSGVYIGPIVFLVQLRALNGTALTLHPVRDAFLLAVSAFVGLTLYVTTTKKDFSYMRGFLSAGIWVVLLGLIIGIFVQSSAFSLAIASAGVLLFCGYILYDTSRLLKRTDKERSQPVEAAIELFLDFLNLFVFLLRILGGGRK